MHELDLIPASYREWLKVKGWFRLFALSVALVITCVAVLKFITANSTKAVSGKIQVLQQNKVVNLGLQKRFNDLAAEEIKLKKDLEVLQGLQGGPTVKEMLTAIDRAVQEGVWFTQWSFNRAREILPVQPDASQNGYFIVIPQADANAAGQQAWKLTAHMEITGQAINHSSFSNFVNNLIKQPEFDDVKVISTSLESSQGMQAVAFKIVVVINHNFKGRDV